MELAEFIIYMAASIRSWQSQKKTYRHFTRKTNDVTPKLQDAKQIY